MAWLHAAPKPDERTMRAKNTSGAPLPSRIDRMRAKGILPKMPPHSAPHVITRLVEIGISEAAGMGVAPVSWPTIDAWCRRTGIELDPWEARLLRSLSAAYIAESRRAEAETCPPPWNAPVTKAEVAAEQAALIALLG